MRAHTIEDGKVVNTIEVLNLDFMPNLIDAERGGKIGDLWDGETFHEPMQDIAEVESAIAQTYKDVDSIISDAVGYRVIEYIEAEKAAAAYRDAGYQGVVSEYVSGYATNNPTGQVQSAQWAADQIIGRAEAMRAAQLAMRNERFSTQAAMRAATTKAEFEQACSQWSAFVAATRTVLGV